MRNHTLLGSLVLLSACSGSADAPSAATPSATQIAAAPAPVFALTDDLLSRYATYQREMMPALGAVLGVAGAAFDKGGGDATQFAAAAARDSRTQQIQKVSEAALAKSGLTQATVAQITTLVTPYYAKAMFAVEAKKTLAADEGAKAEGAKAKKGALGDIMRGVYQKQVDEFEQFKKEFATKHGAETVAVLDEHTDEMVALQKQVLEAALNKEPTEK